MKISTAMAILLLSALPAAALAQETHWYGGMGLGQSKASGACGKLTGTGFSCEDSDTAVKVFGGYQMNRNLALELGYTDLGEMKATGNGIGNFGTSVSVSARGPELTGIGLLPIGEQASLFGRAGVFAWRVEASDSRSSAGSTSASGTSLTYGLGVKVDFTKGLMLRLEWQRYKDVGDESKTGQSDFDFIGVGLAFKF